MKELILIMAKVMPREKLAEMVGEAIELYKADATDENWAKLNSACMLLSTKNIVDNAEKKGETIFDTIKDMDRVEKAAQLYNPEII